MMEQSMVLYFFGGVSQDGFGWQQDFDKVLLELARWLLPLGICLMAQGACLEKWRRIEPLSCYRHGAVGMWWRHQFVRGMCSGLIAAAALFIPAMAADMVRAVFVADKVWRVLVLWQTHIMTTMSFFLTLDLTRYRRIAQAMLLVLEGFTFLVGYQSVWAARFLYGMWGMYFQSQWHFGQTGVPVLVSLAAEGILLVLSYLAGEAFLRGGGYVFSGG